MHACANEIFLFQMLVSPSSLFGSAIVQHAHRRRETESWTSPPLICCCCCCCHFQIAVPKMICFVYSWSPPGITRHYIFILSFLQKDHLLSVVQTPLWVFLLFLMNPMFLSQTAESTTSGSPVTADDAGQVNLDELVNPAVQNGKHSLVTSQTLQVWKSHKRHFYFIKGTEEAFSCFFLCHNFVTELLPSWFFQSHSDQRFPPCNWWLDPGTQFITGWFKILDIGPNFQS